jgi:hypothetical protein
MDLTKYLQVTNDEILYFFPNSLLPLISSHHQIIKHQPNTWSFHNNIFNYNNSKPTKLPYISASLYKDNTLIADISEWAERMIVHSDTDLPIPILIISWGYSTNFVFDTYDLSQYKLCVITLDGDEKMYKATGEQIA